MLDTGIKSNAKKNGRLAVIHCLEIMKLKNPNEIEEIGENRYAHVSTTGRFRIFTVLSTAKKYFAWRKDNPDKEKKLHKVMGYYIVEEANLFKQEEMK